MIVFPSLSFSSFLETPGAATSSILSLKGCAIKWEGLLAILELRKQRRLRKKFQRMNKECCFSEEEETEKPEESEEELKPQLFMSITSTPIITTIMSYINMLRRRCQRKVVTNHHFGGYPIPNTEIIEWGESELPGLS